MRKAYEYKEIPAEFKDLDEKKGIATGYFSAFGNVDHVGDMVMPGAFNKTIAEQGPASEWPRIKHLLNHDGFMPVGKLQVLQPDNYGLFFESAVGTHNDGKDFIKKAESGLITENSIGYSTLKSFEREDGVKELREIALYEGSSLTFLGCNKMARFMGMKSEEVNDHISDRIRRLEKFCRNSTATDETIETLLLEIKQLNQLVFDLKAQGTTVPAPIKATQPEKAGGINWTHIANQLITNQFSPQ